MNKRFFFSAVFALIIVIQACHKYEEGPSLSLRTRKERVANVWVVEDYIINGKSDSAALSSMKILILKLEKDGTGEMAALNETNAVEWEFIDKKSGLKMRFQYDDGKWGEWSESKILKLEETHMWLKKEVNDTLTVETHYNGE